MSLGLHHCVPLRDTPAPDPAASTTGTDSLLLPPGLDADLFTPEQLEYLSDLYNDTLHHHLRLFYRLLRATPAGVDPTPRRVGINAAILCKLLGLTDAIRATTWRSLKASLGCRSYIYNEQRTALLDAVRRCCRKH